MRCLVDDLRDYGIYAHQWATAAHDQREWHQTVEHGTDVSWRNWSLQRKLGLDYGTQFYAEYARTRRERQRRGYSSKKACSCWFARQYRLATSSATCTFRVFLFAYYVSLPFSGITFFFYLRFSLFLVLFFYTRPLVQSFCMCPGSRSQLANNCMFPLVFCLFLD